MASASLALAGALNCYRGPANSTGVPSSLRAVSAFGRLRATAQSALCSCACARVQVTGVHMRERRLERQALLRALWSLAILRVRPPSGWLMLLLNELGRFLQVRLRRPRPPLSTSPSGPRGPARRPVALTRLHSVASDRANGGACRHRGRAPSTSAAIARWAACLGSGRRMLWRPILAAADHLCFPATAPCLRPLTPATHTHAHQCTLF